ncbi:flagellar hook-length control protein FliK [Novosphingobium sp. BL-8H]|uniref:flagellar hook-length control protein FliK n=1 Tax=Novosphingobium sp. BL-8H TaxID=3127640 RepID=UPI0037573E4B
MTVSINAVLPMTAPAASSPAASALGSGDGKASSFGSMVDDAASTGADRPQSQSAKSTLDRASGSKADRSKADKAQSGKADRADKADKAPTDKRQADEAGAADTPAADAASGGGDAAEVAVDAQATAETAADTLAEALPADALPTIATATPVVTASTAEAQPAPGPTKPMNVASHLAAKVDGKTDGAGKAGLPVAATNPANAAPGDATATTAADSAATGEPAKANDHARTADADDQAVPLPVQQAVTTVTPTATPAATAQVALAGAQVVAENATGENAKADAAPGIDSKGQAAGTGTATFAAAPSHGATGKHVAFAPSAESAASSGGTGHTAAAGTGTGTREAALATSDTASSGADGSTLSSPVLTQTFATTAMRPAALPYATAASTTQTAMVSVQEGQFGNDIGVQIARALDKGGNDLLIKLDPQHMGRIDVRLSFDHDGVLRAVMSADSSTATDLLRRESTDLNRALADAGIRADSQSLRFDTRAGGHGGGHGGQGHNGQGNQRWQGQQAGMDDFSGGDDPIYRSLGSSGHVDLMA